MKFFFDLELKFQALRFVAVGAVSNIFLYMMYIFLTRIGLGHKTAMILLFVVGAAQNFTFNKRWVFRCEGLMRTALLKYITIYMLAFIINLASLFVLVDIYSYPHQIVQAIMIVGIALMLFLLQKFWVFS